MLFLSQGLNLKYTMEQPWVYTWFSWFMLSGLTTLPSASITDLFVAWWKHGWRNLHMMDSTIRICVCARASIIDHVMDQGVVWSWCPIIQVLSDTCQGVYWLIDSCLPWASYLYNMYSANGTWIFLTIGIPTPWWCIMHTMLKHGGRIVEVHRISHGVNMEVAQIFILILVQ